jgi:molecular chaperone GrpE
VTQAPDHDREPGAPEGPVIRDRRRIDPVTGKVREPREGAAPGPSGQPSVGPDGTPNGTTAQRDADAGVDLEAKLAERTGDLQRLQAEYVNYKRRVDRDREVARDSAVANVVLQLLPVLDDIGRAREHGELEGGFKAVAESLERIVGGLGLVSFGEPGDPFDPRIHEALMHSYSEDVTGPTAGMILAPGYRIGERTIRPARVAVLEPEPEQSPLSDGGEAGPEAEPDEPAEQRVADDATDDAGDLGEPDEERA